MQPCWVQGTQQLACSMPSSHAHAHPHTRTHTCHISTAPVMRAASRVPHAHVVCSVMYLNVFHVSLRVVQQDTRVASGQDDHAQVKPQSSGVDSTVQSLHAHSLPAAVDVGRDDLDQARVHPLAELNLLRLTHAHPATTAATAGPEPKEAAPTC